MAGTHGGARAGAGRKPAKERARIGVSLRLHREWADALREKAQQAGVSQSAIVEMALTEIGIWIPMPPK